MIELMVKVFTFIQMGLNMMEIGWRISNMVEEKRPGQMEPFMRDNTKKVKKRVMGSLYGVIKQLILDTLVTTIFMV